MNCTQENIEKIGADWNFFLEYVGSGSTPLDLNGLSYSYKLKGPDGQIAKEGSGNITLTGTELVVTIAGTETIGYDAGVYEFEFKLVYQGATDISDIIRFHAEETLHSNSV